MPTKVCREERGEGEKREGRKRGGGEERGEKDGRGNVGIAAQPHIFSNFYVHVRGLQFHCRPLLVVITVRFSLR